MRLATFNLENMFSRAKALGRNWDECKPVLEAYKELNSLFDLSTYSSADKERMLKLMADHGLLRSDDGDFLMIRKIRGNLVKRPKDGEPEIVAAGRSSWLGWVELKTEPVNEIATLNTARALHAVNADVQAVIEAEDRTTLKLFNEEVFSKVSGCPFDHVMLVDGNDQRGIDVGIMSRSSYPIASLRSHVDDRDSKGKIFSRDCAEYEIALPGGKSLWVLINHFKSKGYGSQSASDAKRKRQAKRVREIYEQHLAEGDEFVAVVGDLNEVPSNDPLSPLIGLGSTLRDISEHPQYDGQGFVGTHGNCAASGKLDYILLSPALYAKVDAAGIERRGMWGGAKGTLWPRFPEVGAADEAASDHAALWVDLDV